MCYCSKGRAVRNEYGNLAEVLAHVSARRRHWICDRRGLRIRAFLSSESGSMILWFQVTNYRARCWEWLCLQWNNKEVVCAEKRKPKMK
ncbi:hypothetical protein I7I53_10418 [Histoplasma capsulatum var. duboisii H88]|uniref:Uncharacterized protein n=1 Tax=Ajellomyces capsulatus (strain H88) TaxID=544711 RepID=A0A8A1L8L1_AJEC8|nr:hypothetical protein I7I53_10418 [Histoplasma capsulatum var. duboisii H88]